MRQLINYAFDIGLNTQKINMVNKEIQNYRQLQQIGTKKIRMKPGSVDKNCQLFMAKLYNSKHWDIVKQMLKVWKAQQKNIVSGMDIFKEIMKSLESNEDAEQKIIEAFNKCLVKDARLTKKIIGEYQSEQNPIESTPYNQPNSFSQPNIIQSRKQEQNQSFGQLPHVPRKNIKYEKIKQTDLCLRIQQHHQGTEIDKILQLYLKSIITLQEFRAILLPLYQNNPSLIGTILQLAQSIQKRRRKNTIFAPLNELIDKKYPVQQVGSSYIIIPEGYANFGQNWHKNPMQNILNRKIVSVPLGSQVSFIIGKKNQYEQQLFQYEDQRYEIDNALQSLKACQKMINKYCQSQNNSASQKLASSLLERVINSLYPDQNIYNIFIRHPKLAKQILLPRITQKRQQLEMKKQEFMKVCQQVAQKNFARSLDYRCIYFAKNDKKYNTPARWEKQIQMRRNQLLKGHNLQQNEVKHDIEDRQSMIRSRNEFINSFDHITNEKFLADQSIHLSLYERASKSQQTYPNFPENKIFFILNFKDRAVLNDVLQIILSGCIKKNLLEILIFKGMKLQIKRTVKKNQSMLTYLDSDQKIQSKQNLDGGNIIKEDNLQILEGTYLNDTPSLLRDTKLTKDSEQEFMQIIDEDEQAAFLEIQQSPFEGPQNTHTFIGTKPMYLFFRYLLTIYQRFLMAKQYSMQKLSQKCEQTKSEKIDLYQLFLNTLIFKMKEKNKSNFQECLRKIFLDKAYIFFTLDKLISGATKIINLISSESLTHKIIKDQTRDYELGILDWSRFPFLNITEQLTRLYQEKETLFRFSFCSSSGNFYISVWNPYFSKYYDEDMEVQRKNVQDQIFYSTSNPIYHRNFPGEDNYQQETIMKQILREDNVENFLAEDEINEFTERGQHVLCRRKNPQYQIGKTRKQMAIEMKKLKKLHYNL